jgi:hypothetical protein
MKLSSLSAILLAAGVAAGCAGTGEVEYGGAVNVASPDLVEVEPGVQVIADADEPIFYSDGFYWQYRDGFWLRSNYYNNGFARVDVNYVPVRVRGIDNPRAYVHYRRHEGRGYARPAPEVRRNEPYRAEGGVTVQRGTPVYREEHREERHENRGPVIRDHRHDHDHDHDRH